MRFLLVTLLACFAVAAASAADLSSHGLLAEVWRASSGLYVAKLNLGTPPQPKFLLLDIAQNYIWVECSSTTMSGSNAFSPSLSSTFHRVTHGRTPAFVDIPSATRAVDSFTFNFTDGSNPGLEDVEVKDVKFFCSSSRPPSSTSSPVASGVVGLGRGKLALPSLLAIRHNLPRRFAYCLSGGMVPTPLFFGSSNYTFMQGHQLSNLIHTPLMKPRKKKPGYRVGLLSITLGDKALSIGSNVFTGGLEISTREPYTKLVRPAYEALRDAFRVAESGIKRVPAQAPFDTCFNATGLGSTRVGPPVNTIGFVIGDHAGNVTWPFFGDSSMVYVSEDVICLGFLDAGPPPAHSILGIYQQEDSLVEIDLDKSMLGFYSTLPFIQTTCGNFNFTRSNI